ncbi:MAG: hypothetical protein KGY69_06850 [Bacteroidales bacterium]|nr:hypothetical protein [Bacteroidales bacterium]
MKRKYILISLPLLVLFSIVFFTSCEKEKVEPPDNKTENGNTQDTIAQLNKAFYNLMNEWYYWYEKIPDIDPDDYDDSNPMKNLRNILDDIRYENDSYSYITSYEAFLQYFEEGSYTGYGFGYKWDDKDTLRLTFVFDESPLKEEGIERGWALTKVNGNTVTPDNFNQLLGGEENDFTFISPDGDETVNSAFARKNISMNTVLKDTVIEYKGNRVGYLVLKSFIDKTPDELTEAFSHFNDENIDELIIDLRYNGGGTLSASRFLGEFIYEAGSNDIYVEITHSDKKSERDTTHVFGQDSLNINLGLNKVYFLTTQATASASEALINGLKPTELDVYTIGEATYGKPVGMYPFTDNNNEYAFLPVCFSLKNAAGDADYYDGLQPDAAMNDDFKQPFGSLDDDFLYQALYHIENDNFDMKKTREIMKPRPENRVEYKSLQDEIGAL